jgi:hypothetical protein
VEGRAIRGQHIEVKIHASHLPTADQPGARDKAVALGGSRSRKATLTHREQMTAGQSGSSQKAHDSTAVPHLEHVLTLVVLSLIPFLLPFGAHLSEAASLRVFRPKS